MTFIGYLVGGWTGAAVATVGIFLPAFAFVAVTHPILPRLRRSATLSAALDGINAVALGLMALAVVRLTGAAISGPLTAALAVAAAVALVRSRVGSVLLVAVGGLVGVLAGAF